MDGLDFITALIGHGVVKSATTNIDGKPHNFEGKKPSDFSAWIHGFKGTDPATIDGTIRFAKHTGGGGIRIAKGVATPIASAGRPPIASDRLCVSTPLDPEVVAWVKSQGPIAAFVRGLVDAAYREHLEQQKTRKPIGTCGNVMGFTIDRQSGRSCIDRPSILGRPSTKRS